MARPIGYVNTEYLRVVGEFVSHLKQRTYAFLQLEAGQRVLDMGCGPGSDTLQLAGFVGQTGQVVGVDYDQDMIDQAESRATTAGVSGWVIHRRARAEALPFATGYFDACRSERVFQHLPAPQPALAEMVRVTKSGGRIVVLDADWGSMSVDTQEIDIERRLSRVTAEQGRHNGYSGRRLYRLFKQHQLEEIAVEVHPLVAYDYAFGRQAALLDETERLALASGIVTEAELHRWHTDLEQAHDAGQYFGYMCQVLVAGRKP